jgi:transcription elongation factor Elf1
MTLFSSARPASSVGGLRGKKTAVARPLARTWLCSLCGEQADAGRFVALGRGGYAAVCRACGDRISSTQGRGKDAR